MSDDARERWNAKYAGREPEPVAPSSALLSLDSFLPAPGPALDLACGRGSNARWLAERGFDVTGVDVSDVAIEAATAFGIGRFVRLDLEHDALPAGPFALAICVDYLQRDLWARAHRVLRPGAVAVWVHPTRQNAARHAKPSARFLLDAGEAQTVLSAAGFTVTHAVENWFGHGERARHLARVVGRRDPTR